MIQQSNPQPVWDFEKRNGPITINHPTIKTLATLTLGMNGTSIQPHYTWHTPPLRGAGRVCGGQ